jgi:hypothetical protein
MLDAIGSPHYATDPSPLLSPGTYAAPGGFTALRSAAGLYSTKTFGWYGADRGWHNTGYKPGLEFEVTEFAGNSHQELICEIVRLATDPRTSIVRGALTPAARALGPCEKHRRLIKRDPTTPNYVPPFMSISRQWVMIDIEKLILPPSHDILRDPVSAIKWATRATLPRAFQDVAVFYQFSASTGFAAANELRVHLWYWLDRPTDDATLRDTLMRLTTNPPIDDKLWLPTQVHFIADPIIHGPPPPLPERFGWITGSRPSVALPILAPVDVPSKRGGRRKGQGEDAGGVRRRSGGRSLYSGLQDALAHLGYPADGSGSGFGFNTPLVSASMFYARECQRGARARDDAAYIAMLLPLIRAAAIKCGRNPEEYTGLVWHQNLIDTAFARIDQQQDDAAPAAAPIAPASSPDAARRRLRETIETAMRSAIAAWQAGPTDMPHVGINAETGLGKTEELIIAIKIWLAHMRAAGLPHRVLYFMPGHKLSTELLKRFTDHGISAAVYKGRLAKDKKTDEYTECLEPKKVGFVNDLQIDAGTYACGRGDKPEQVCQSHGLCPFQRRVIDCKNADVVILASTLLFHDPDKLNIGKFGLAVIDESWWQTGLKLRQKIKMTTFVEDVDAFPPVCNTSVPYDMETFKKKRRKKGDQPWPKGMDLAARNRLFDASMRMTKLFDSAEAYELVSREALIKNGFSSNQCYQFERDEWTRKVEPADLSASMTFEEMQKLKWGSAAKNNQQVVLRATQWHEFGVMLELDSDQPAAGRVQIGEKANNKGNRGSMLLHGRERISKKILALPIIYGDATMPGDAITREYLPRFERLADIGATAPHLHLVQIQGEWGRRKLLPADFATTTEPDDGEDDGENDDPFIDGEAIDPEHASGVAAENAKRTAKLSEIRDFILSRAQGESALLITYKDLEPAFQGIPGLNVIHFADFRGLDEYGKVRWLFVLGRPLPSPLEISVIARALKGLALPPRGPVFVDRHVNMVDGSKRTIRTLAYDDQVLEAVRASISDAEGIQGIGRVRGVNRDEETPCTAFLMTDTVVSYPLAALVPWGRVKLGAPERMAARGLFLNSPGDAAVMYGDLFVSTEAARWALDGVVLLRWAISRCNCLSKKESLSCLSKCTAKSADATTQQGYWLKSAIYRQKGRGQQWRKAWVSADQVVGLRDKLTEKLGPLARFQVDIELTLVKIVFIQEAAEQAGGFEQRLAAD